VNEEVFDLTGAARYLDLSNLQTRTLAKAGRATYSRIDRLHWRFMKRDLDSYIARNTFQAKTVYQEK